MDYDSDEGGGGFFSPLQNPSRLQLNADILQTTFNKGKIGKKFINSL